LEATRKRKKGRRSEVYLWRAEVYLRRAEEYLRTTEAYVDEWRD